MVAPNGLSGCSVTAFLSLFSTTFFLKCGRGECLMTTTCLVCVVGGMQGHAPCRIVWLGVNDGILPVD